MSSSARAVFFGSRPGIGLLMKCTTCARSGFWPVVSGGARSALFAKRLEKSVGHALRPVAPVDHHRARHLHRARVGEVEEQHRRLRAGIEAPLAGAAQVVAHDDRHVAEVDVHRAGGLALVADGAMVGHVAELVVVRERDAAARLLLVQDRLDEQRGGEDLVARRVEQVGARHVRRARRLALAAAQAVLDRARHAAEVGLRRGSATRRRSARSSAYRRWRGRRRRAACRR